MCDVCGCSTPEAYVPAEDYPLPQDTYQPPEVYTEPTVYEPAPAEVPMSTDVNPVTGDVGYDAGMARLDWLVDHPEASQPGATVPPSTMMGGIGQAGNAADAAVGGAPGHGEPGAPEYTRT